MNAADRISRIERALVAAGIMEPDPMPSDVEILVDLMAGDKSSFEKAAVLALKTGRRIPLTKPRKGESL